MHNVEWYLDELIERYPALAGCRETIFSAYEFMRRAYEQGGKLLIAGNGGSAADSEHMVGELMKRFQLSRQVRDEFAEKLKSVDGDRGALLARNLERALPAISLVTHEALLSAYINDVDSYSGFAQQLFGLGKMKDVFVGISTSGNSQNIINAAITAKAMGITSVALTGEDGGDLAKLADVSVRVPARKTYQVQELHLPVYHCWCNMLEEYFFG